MRVYVPREVAAERDRKRYHSGDLTHLTAMPFDDGHDGEAVAMICVGCWWCSPDDRAFVPSTNDEAPPS